MVALSISKTDFQGTMPKPPGEGYFTMRKDRDVRQFWVVFGLKIIGLGHILMELSVIGGILSLGIFMDWGLLLYSKFW